MELVWLPDANHWPLRPKERMTAQEGAVDWFVFWLRGVEDPDPEKASQYVRWRALEALRPADKE